MGMFDYVRCDYPLPDGYEPEHDKALQSKDGPCQLLQLWITAGGRLVSLHEQRGEVKDEFYNGEFLFYGYPAQSHSYLAKFLGGQLINIVDLNFKMPEDELIYT